MRSPHQRPIKRQPAPSRRRALERLAACPEGCTEALMLANGFSVDLLVDLVRAELASATAEHVAGGGKTIEVARVRITEAGRKLCACALRGWTAAWRLASRNVATIIKEAVEIAATKGAAGPLSQPRQRTQRL
jgi:hypothetical protein